MGIKSMKQDTALKIDKALVRALFFAFPTAGMFNATTDFSLPLKANIFDIAGLTSGLLIFLWMFWALFLNDFKNDLYANEGWFETHRYYLGVSSLYTSMILFIYFAKENQIVWSEITQSGINTILNSDVISAFLYSTLTLILSLLPLLGGLVLLNAISLKNNLNPFTSAKPNDRQ